MMTIGKCKIRPATIADAQILPAIERSAALLFGEVPGYERRANNPVIDQVTHTHWMSEGCYLVAEWGPGLCVGFLAARPYYGSLIILQISVRRAFQKRGIARSLITCCLSEGQANRFNDVWLRTDPSFSWYASFCNSMGFYAQSKDDVLSTVLLRSAEDPRLQPGSLPERSWMVRNLHRTHNPNTEHLSAHARIHSEE